MNQYKMFELSFKGAEPVNSQADAYFDTTFTFGDKVQTVKGFYAGNGVYRVRFYPQQCGEYRWKAEADVHDHDRLIRLQGNLEGTAVCGKADERAHGIVRVNGYHFRYDDNTRYQPFGTTVYALIHQDIELVDQTFDTLSKAPFNKVRFCVFPKHYDYNHNEPDCFAFEKTENHFDFDRPCFEFWDKLEKRIVQLDEMGIQGDLIIFHPYDRWGFSGLSYEECMKYIGYLVRRLAAYPNLWWSLANEYDLMENFKREWWGDFAEFIGRNDPFGHCLSNHNCLPYWDFSNPYTTHCCIQDTNVNRVRALQEQYGKPVVFDEVCYEGNIEHVWGNISGFEMVHRFWTAHILGGYCTHGETFLSSDEILWWSRGGVLKGESPARIAFLRKLMEELPADPEILPGHWDELNPERVQKFTEEEKNKDIWTLGLSEVPVERLYRFTDREAAVQSHCGNDVFMRYFGHQCCAKNFITLPEDSIYDIEAVDIWEMTRTVICRGASGKTELRLPGKEGIAVFARRVVDREN